MKKETPRLRANSHSASATSLANITPEKRGSSKVALYRRVSTQQQTRSFGLERQLRACIALLKKLGLPDYKPFTDKGQPGDNLDRKRFKGMIQAIEAGSIKIVVAFSISRISRRIDDLWPLLHEWRKSGVRVLTVLEKYDSDESLELQVRRLMRYACRTDKIGLKSAVKARNIKVRKGGRGPGNIPYGYIALANGDVAIDEKKAQTVKEIFKYHKSGIDGIRGMSDQRIADKLTEQKIPTPSWPPKSGESVSQWGSSTIAGILSNPKYIGVWVQMVNGSEVVSSGIAPAIINDFSCCDRIKNEWVKIAKQATKTIAYRRQ